MSPKGSSQSVAVPAATGRVNTLGLGERQLGALLDILDLGEAANKVSPRREFVRRPFRITSLRMKLIHPGGSEVELRVASRNLSRGGACLLHNAFIYPGTPCQIFLPLLDGGTERVAGVICRCSHRRGALHELGIKFTKQIDLKLFIAMSLSGEGFSLELVAPQSLKGKLLFVNDCTIDQKIIRHYLRESGLEVTNVETASAAIDHAFEQFDVILTNWTLPDMSGTQLIAKLREAGIEVPAVVMTADPASAIKDGYLSLSCVRLLTKPVNQETLVRSLAECLLTGQTPEKSPAHAAGDGAFSGDVLEEILAEMRKGIKQLQEVINGEDLTPALRICTMLKSAAPTMGQPALGTMASKAMACIAAAQPLNVQKSMLRELAEAATHRLGG